jgi:hypothetical protein
MHLLCKALGLQSGRNAHDCCNKYLYYLTACQQKGGINQYDSTIKASTGDIPLPDANAIDYMMHSAVDEENNTELVKDKPDMPVVGKLNETIKARNPKSEIFKKINSDVNIPYALHLVAKFCTPIDQDHTADLAGSPDIPILEKKFASMGYKIEDLGMLGDNISQPVPRLMH